MNSVNNTLNGSMYGQHLNSQIISQTINSMDQYSNPAGATATTATTTSGAGVNGTRSGNNLYNSVISGTLDTFNSPTYASSPNGNAMSNDYNFQQSFLSNAYPESGTGALINSHS